jgi:hypothetical protein
MRKGLRKPLATVAMLVVAGLTAGIAWAAIPDGTGLIHACYSTSDKSLRVVDSAGCMKNELPVSWTQNAVQGLQGPPGNQGSKGDTGSRGAAGLTFAKGQSDYVVTDSVIGGFAKVLTCPSGTKALDGAWDWWVLNGSKRMDQPVAESVPIGDDEWLFAVGADHDYTSQPMNVHLRCVYAP